MKKYTHRQCGGEVETPLLTEDADVGLEYAPFDDDDGLVDCDSRPPATMATAGTGPSTGLAVRHRSLPRKRRKRKAATGEAVVLLSNNRRTRAILLQQVT
ncbi:PREDICTED: serine/arginine repetitive matrix protein 3-like [Rhinopithecus bieti]|uniref:serine/arginine repetitive matrix protein 3-like n=1 Tax=Rhinopithecus bieti TaxID=61621 RepID=UPI00083C5B63|nr:PREDICTED: serine/arginine repetitive matrix protein 3-like [Rhinopithecus bieti]